MGNFFRRIFGGDTNNENQPRAPPSSGPKELKIVLVGATTVGKSCLIRNYKDQIFEDNYEPTVLDVFRGPKAYKGKQVMLEIHDTSGDQYLG